MSREEIADKVIEVIKNAVNIDLTKYADQLAEKSLFDLEIGLLPRDLLEIFFELQKVFDIAFEETDAFIKGKWRHFGEVNYLRMPN